MGLEVRQLKGIADEIGSRYFIDPDYEEVGDAVVRHWKILMGVFTYAARANAQLLGDPGFGKTTYANVIGSVMSGLPYDLLSSLQIQGHPDQTKDNMLSRADLGRLAEEGVVWQASIFLPSLTFDEFNMLPPGKQAIVREYIRTGIVEHLGKVYSDGKPPFFATFNPDAEGVYPLTKATRDRFDISLEFVYLGAILNRDALDARDRIREELVDHNVTLEALKKLHDKDMPVDQKRTCLLSIGKAVGARRAVKPLDRDELDELYVNVRKISFTPKALMFVDSILEEINTTPTYGLKRSNDPVDLSIHNKDAAESGAVPLMLGNGCVEGPISHRFRETLEPYAQLLAASLGDNVVDVKHVFAVAPYAMVHRINFNNDYKGRYAQQKRLRGEREELDLSRRLLNEIKKRFDRVKNDVLILSYFLDEKVPPDNNQEKFREFMLQLEERERPTDARQIFASLTKAEDNTIDHPLVKRLAREARAILRQQRR